MKITFDDKSYIDVQKSSEPGKVLITIMAKDQFNDLKNIANSVEITVEEFEKLFKSVM